MLRTSSYTICSHLPGRKEALLVHGYTGAYDRVSQEVAEFLRANGGPRPKPLHGEWKSEEPVRSDLVTPPDETIARLEKRGYMTRMTREEEEGFFSKFAEKLHERALSQPPSYVFMVTYDCNLRCSYCYQDHMRTDPALERLLRSMTPETVDRIFAAMPEIEALQGMDGEGRRSIGLFGGEPLLAENRPVVERIIQRAGGGIWAVTNGTELEAYRDLLGPHGLARLQITLDGPAEKHDRRRIYADGSGSFERIADNISMALECGAEVGIRLNIDRKNLDDLPLLAEDIVERGWDAQPGFSTYTAPVRAANPKTPQATTMSPAELDQALVALRDEYPEMGVIGRPDEEIRSRARRIFEGEKGVTPSLRPSFCGAHDRMYIFDPFGDIYACWEKTGDSKVRIGNIAQDGNVSFRFDQHNAWRGRSVASSPVCRRCRYALFCGGGCAILALGMRGNFNANYCDGFAKRFRTGLTEAYLTRRKPQSIDSVPGGTFQ